MRGDSCDTIWLELAKCSRRFRLMDFNPKAAFSYRFRQSMIDFSAVSHPSCRPVRGVQRQYPRAVGYNLPSLFISAERAVCSGMVVGAFNAIFKVFWIPPSSFSVPAISSWVTFLLLRKVPPSLFLGIEGCARPGDACQQW